MQLLFAAFVCALAVGEYFLAQRAVRNLSARWGWAFMILQFSGMVAGFCFLASQSRVSPNVSEIGIPFPAFVVEIQEGNHAFKKIGVILAPFADVAFGFLLFVTPFVLTVVWVFRKRLKDTFSKFVVA